jgi:hypothetical protein
MFENLQDEIRILNKQERHLECLSKSKKLLEIIKIKDKNNIKLLYFCHFYMSKSYFKVNQIDLAMKHAKMAVTYTNDLLDRGRTYWMICRLYESSNITKAVEYIEFTIKDFLAYGLEKNEMFFAALSHKAFLLNDEDLMNEVITGLKSIKASIERMDETYEDLVNVYIHNNKILNAQLLLSKIHSTTIKNRLRNKMYKQSQTVNAF